MFSGIVEARVNANRPKNGPVPDRPVNGYGRRLRAPQNRPKSSALPVFLSLRERQGITPA